ncbi:MAG: FixH family protein [Pseudomonadota bacterium]
MRLPTSLIPSRLTGAHVAAFMGLAFLTIVGANTALVVAATGSFPGIVVKNSYVASQDFEARRAAARATGWTVTPGWEDGRLVVAVTGAEGPVDALNVTAVIGRPAEDTHDRAVLLRPAGEGRYVVTAALAPGRWQARIALSPEGAAAAPMTVRHVFSVAR